MSQIHRFYVPGPYVQGQSIELDDETSRIISSVLRLAENDLIYLMNGTGGLAKCALTQVRKKSVACIVEEFTQQQKPEKTICLLVALLKGEKAEWMIQKCTELGVSEILFFEGKHSVTKSNSNALKRAEKIAIEAIRQSGNPFLPNIQIFPSLAALFAAVDLTSVDKLWMNEQEPLLSLEAHFANSKRTSVLVAVGPEGGFSTEEKDLFKKYDFYSIRFGSYILRSETAAVAVTSVWTYLLDRSTR